MLTPLRFRGRSPAWCFALLVVLAACRSRRSGSTPAVDAAAGIGDGPFASVRLAAGESHTCVVSIDGALFCWGDNGSQQVGAGAAPPSTVVRVSTLPRPVRSVGAGTWHTCAVMNDGAVSCWGASMGGTLGPASDGSDFAKPVQLSLPSGALAVYGGVHHGCAVLADGRNVFCWGSNEHENLGIAAPTPVDQKRGGLVGGLGGRVVQFSTSYHHNCAVLETGDLRCWGWNSAGQLGDGTKADRGASASVTALTGNAAFVAAGVHHTCAVSKSGGAWCWGMGGARLGRGTYGDSAVPLPVHGLQSGVRSVAVSTDHSCALLTSGAVKCWGENGSGQLGSGDEKEQASPVDVVGLKEAATELALGERHSCALLKSGAVVCWGANEKGQLGRRGVSRSATPVSVDLTPQKKK